MPEPDESPVITAAQRAVDGPADRVLEDRYTEEGEGTGGGSSTPVIPSPFLARIDPNFTIAPRNHPMRIALDVLSRQKPFDKMRMALVDCTADKMRPVYAGYRDTEQIFIASMAKLAILMPVFALREAARQAAPLIKAKNAADFFKQLGKAWAPEFRKHYRANSNNTDPQLAAILSASRDKDTDPFTIDFIKSPPDRPIDASFFLTLRLALQFSSNSEAASCIRLLGFPYIKGVLKTAGLNGPRGLWMSNDFGGKVWDASYTGSGQEGSARAVAELLTLVTQDRMVVSGLSTEFREVMWWSGADPSLTTLGDMFNGLGAVLPENQRVTLIAQGKVGFLDAGPFADSAIMLRAVKGNVRLRYVAVVLGAASHAEVKAAGVALDDCILTANGMRVKVPGVE